MRSPGHDAPCVAGILFPTAHEARVAGAEAAGSPASWERGLAPARTLGAFGVSPAGSPRSREAEPPSRPGRAEDDA